MEIENRSSGFQYYYYIAPVARIARKARDHSFGQERKRAIRAKERTEKAHKKRE
jgi:hypothetical protein